MGVLETIVVVAIVSAMAALVRDGRFAAPLAGRWLFAARGKPRGEPAA